MDHLGKQLEAAEDSTHLSEGKRLLKNSGYRELADVDSPTIE